MRQGIAVAILTALVLASGLSLVWAREQSRQLDLAVQGQQDRIQRLETRWGRLQLERAALSARSRVERIARQRFGMHRPDPNEFWDLPR